MRPIPPSALEIIDQWLRVKTLRGETLGSQISIRLGEKLVMSKAYGKATKTRRYTTNTFGRVASQSKTLTAAIALWLEDQKLLNLNQKIYEFMPELREAKDKRIKNIRLIDLLMHRSGLHRDSYLRDYWVKNEKFITRSELVSEILGAKLVYPPNRVFKYSNLNYGLAVICLECASGKQFEILANAFLTSRSLKTCYYDESSARVTAEGQIRHPLKPITYRAAINHKSLALLGAAGFYSTTDDTTKFVQALYRSNKILSKTKRQKILSTKRPVDDAKIEKYGLGTIFNKHGKFNYVGHAGSFAGFSSQTWVVPEQELTVGFVFNTNIVKTFDAVRSVVEIIDRLRRTFAKSEWPHLEISPPLTDNYEQIIYVVGRRKALAIPLSGWNIYATISSFSKKNGEFFADSFTGYQSLGERLRFVTKKGQIVAAQVGATYALAARG